MRDNHIGREHAGWSASTLTSCAREIAIQGEYDYYEDVKSGYNKARGEWLHCLFSSDPSPKAGVIKERRVRRNIEVLGYQCYLTGKFDKLDPELGLLIDYKSKHLIPKKPDPSHEAQFNVYVWLVANGNYVNDDGSKGEKINVTVTKGGMHYLTFNPKEPFKKMMYPIWPAEQTKAFIIQRMAPLVLWKEQQVFPACNAFQRFPGKWRCGCAKLEEQIRGQGYVI